MNILDTHLKIADVLSLRQLRGQPLLSEEEMDGLKRGISEQLNLSGPAPAGPATHLMNTLQEVRRLQRGNVSSSRRLHTLIQGLNLDHPDDTYREEALLSAELLLSTQLSAKGEVHDRLGWALRRSPHWNTLSNVAASLIDELPPSTSHLMFAHGQGQWINHLGELFSLPQSETQFRLWQRDAGHGHSTPNLLLARPVTVRLDSSSEVLNDHRLHRATPELRNTVFRALSQLWTETLPELRHEDLNERGHYYYDSYGMTGNDPFEADLSAWDRRMARPADPWNWTESLHASIWEAHIMIGCSAWGVERLGLLKMLNENSRQSLQAEESRIRQRTWSEIDDIAQAFIARQETEHHWNRP